MFPAKTFQNSSAFIGVLGLVVQKAYSESNVLMFSLPSQPEPI